MRRTCLRLVRAEQQARSKCAAPAPAVRRHSARRVNRGAEEHSTLHVLNESYDSAGTRTWITGRATLDPAAASTDTTESPGCLLVYFEPNETQPLVWPLGAPYWVVNLGNSPDYGYAVVSDPMRRNLWILSRTPQLDPQDRAIINGLLQQQGYDPLKLKEEPQP